MGLQTHASSAENADITQRIVKQRRLLPTSAKIVMANLSPWQSLTVIHVNHHIRVHHVIAVVDLGIGRTTVMQRFTAADTKSTTNAYAPLSSQLKQQES